MLHGASDDQTTWQRRTSIERYASKLGIAVVMPTTHLGWYTNTRYGMDYWTYVSEELPKLCRTFFPQMSDRPEDTLAAGLSMGGYGAWKLALGAGETFGAGASLSGALDLVASGKRKTVSESRKRFDGIFGSMEELEGSDDDLIALLQKNVREGRKLPRLYAWCGTEDSLYQDNLRVWEEARSLGYDLSCHETPGDHQWRYWDEYIQVVLRWWLGIDDDLR